ncbi:exopolysaccharide biosynthesis protein [Ahrensia marina]|uniref:Exopolysaccharide biosynthesis protein exod n=1 Tax=Ahrensia marina TaxID=1514904 RepID=A0A0N0E912_9HYPH|nr:exopolysaccharide biosynthesis protein [Ahrensia marina]KPB02902.1 hypothetical protein SU32_01130 [Ahrensia marina]
MRSDNAASQEGSLSKIVDKIRSGCKGTDAKVQVSDLLSTIGDKSMLPAILVPALIVATPLSGVPGVSVVGGLLIALFSFELVFNFRRVYLPAKLRSQSIDVNKLDSAMKKIAPVIKWIDRHSRSRLRFLFRRPLIWVPQLLCLFTGLMMPFLEFIPFSSSIAAIGVALLVMSMLTEDGMFFLLAMLPYALAIYLILGL